MIRIYAIMRNFTKLLLCTGYQLYFIALTYASGVLLDVKPLTNVVPFGLKKELYAKHILENVLSNFSKGKN